MAATAARYKVTIKYLDEQGAEHTIQAKFSSLMLALTNAKATCLKPHIKEVIEINIDEVK